MRSSAARKVTPMALPLPDDTPHSPPAAPTHRIDTSLRSTDATPSEDGLPPPTKAQAFFWAEVCGAVHTAGRGGMPGDGWPPELGPDTSDLKDMAERGLLARRRGAWRLRRQWYERLCALKARTVPTPVLDRVERPAPNSPTYGELEAYERICRWLDARPRARSRLPFVGLAALGAEDEEPVLELRAMRRLRLVRHTSRCEWALSSRWREHLRELQRGVARALRKLGPGTVAAPVATSLCAGLDTWGLNWVVEAKALPPRLRAELDDAQREAQAAEREVETRWAFDGVSLRIYQAGVRAKGIDGKRSRGVSWSYILVNPSLRLLIRRTPLGGIVANARLGSECLWRRTPLDASNELNAIIRRMWGREAGRDAGHWQVSYAHLAHDVANAPLETEQLDRYVSRSRRRALYDAAQAEADRLRREWRAKQAGCSDANDGENLDSLDGLDWDALPLHDWEATYGEEEELLMADPFAEEGYEWDAWGHATSSVHQAQHKAKVALEDPVERRALTVHHWGKRLSGVAFSQGGPVSFVMNRKDWEGRLKGKRHMEPLWKPSGWDGKAPVTRHEARLVREPIRELHLVGSDRAHLDDPWEFLACEGDVWGSIVGRSEACPGAVDVAWIRRVVPRAGESNRSRWDTDPAWRVVQLADFSSASLAARRLIRAQQRRHDIKKLDQQLLGLLKTREALLRVDPTDRDLSVALRDVQRALERELVRRGEEFGEAARWRRRDRGLPVSMGAKVLPFRSRREDTELEDERARFRVRELDAAIDGMDGMEVIEQAQGGVDMACAMAERHGQVATTEEGSGGDEDRGGGTLDRVRVRAWLRWRSAETRMRMAFAALEAAEVALRPPREIEQLAVSFERAATIYAQADAILRRLDVTMGPGASCAGRHQEARGECHG